VKEINAVKIKTAPVNQEEVPAHKVDTYKPKMYDCTMLKLREHKLSKA